VRYGCTGGFITYGGPEGHDDRVETCGGLTIRLTIRLPAVVGRL